MAETFKIVERLNLAEVREVLDKGTIYERSPPSDLGKQAATLLQALGEAIEPFAKARDNAEKVALLGPAAVDMACSSKVNASDFDRARSVYLMMKDNGVTPSDARPSSPPPGWQPIETAPKDGKAEVLTWDGFCIRVAVYGWEDKWHTIGMPSHVPTHWMPLPSAPEAKP